jgi:hypothetical protein
MLPATIAPVVFMNSRLSKYLSDQNQNANSAVPIRVTQIRVGQIRVGQG